MKQIVVIIDLSGVNTFRPLDGVVVVLAIL